MRILITGGTGFVGSHVARQLLAAGHNVRLLVRDEKKAQRYYQLFSIPAPELRVGDITDSHSVRRALEGCDALMHAAACTPINAESTEQLFAVNVEGTKNVLGAAVEMALQSIVYVSSITAIFNTDASKVTAKAATTTSTMPYGQSKVTAELYARALQREGAAISIVYPGGIIGPEDPGFSDAFKALHHRIHHGFRLIDDGGIQHVDVRDLAVLIVSLLVEGGAGGYLLPGPYCKWTELADIIERVSGCQLQRIAARGWVLRWVGRILDMLRMIKTVDSPISAETMRYATLWPKIQNTEALLERGLSLRPVEQTFEDSLRWMLAAGYLEAETVPALAAEQ